MQLILLQKVTNLGSLGDKVKVKPGYGRNYLVPQGKAVPATAANLAEFEARRAEYEAKAKAVADAASARIAKLEGVSVTLYANASTEGKLYGSVGPREIADTAPKSTSPKSSSAKARCVPRASLTSPSTCMPMQRPQLKWWLRRKRRNHHIPLSRKWERGEHRALALSP